MSNSNSKCLKYSARKLVIIKLRDDETRLRNSAAAAARTSGYCWLYLGIRTNEIFSWLFCCPKSPRPQWFAPLTGTPLIGDEVTTGHWSPPDTWPAPGECRHGDTGTGTGTKVCCHHQRLRLLYHVRQAGPIFISTRSKLKAEI